MKKILPALCVLLLFIGCKKSGTNPEGTILLSRISFATDGSVYNGRPAVDFIYNGKQLQKTIVYFYFDPNTTTETGNYTYNNQGMLSTVTYNYSPNTLGLTSAYTNAILGYQGTILSNVTINYIVSGGGQSTNENVFSYQGNNLTQWSITQHLDHIFTYDSNGNIIKQVIMYHQPDMNGGTINYLTFDNHHSIANAVPYWPYFITNSDYGKYLLYISSGTNNPLTATDIDGNGNSTNITYSYEYNSYGYPSKMTTTNKMPRAQVHLNMNTSPLNKIMNIIQVN